MFFLNESVVDKIVAVFCISVCISKLVLWGGAVSEKVSLLLQVNNE